MDASCADKLILLVQTNPVLYDNSAAGYKIKDAIKMVIFGRLLLRLVSIVSVLLIYYAVSRLSFIGGGVAATSDLSFLVSRFLFLVSRYRSQCGLNTGSCMIISLGFPVCEYH